MFNHVGNKVKGLAKTIFGVTVGASAIGAIATWVLGSRYGGLSTESFLIGLLIIGAGVLIGWLNSIMMYAFGDLVASTAAVADTNRRMLQGKI